MNRIYRLVFNRTLGLFQVASETTRAHGKSGRVRSPRARRLALAAAIATLPSLVMAAPGAVPGVDGDAGLDASGSMPNHTGTTYGEDGGAGNNGNPANAGGGAGTQGGSGGAGAAGSGFTLTNSGMLQGGNGGVGSQGGTGSLGSGGSYIGAGGTGGMGGSGGTGGTGGAGVSGSGFTVTNSGQINGGVGGDGGQGGTGGKGGAGGVSSMDGLNGGAGGTGGTGGTGGAGGQGGAGVSGSGFTLINETGGMISGGVGSGTSGQGGDGGVGGDPGTDPSGQNPGSAGGSGNMGDQGSIYGAGGVGVKATGNATIINSGTIAGGTHGQSIYTRANAVELSNGGNTFEIRAGSVTLGKVVSNSGALNDGDTLRLGGGVDDSIDVSEIGSSGKYQGFANFAKTGASTWTLTGATSEVTSWKVEGGALSISSDTNLGDVAGNLTLDGGTLRTTADVSSNRNVILGVAGGTVDNEGHDLSLTGGITGSGGLTLVGGGTTTLSGTNDYSGATSITEGTLKADATNTLSSASAVSIISGATLDLNDFDQTIGSLAGGAGGRVDLGAATLTAGADNSSTTFAGVIEGAGGLVKTGSGNMTLSGANTYEGGTTVTGGGTLSVSSDASLGAAGGGISLNNGTLATTADFSSARDIVVSRTQSSDFNYIDNGGHDAEFSGVISGSVGVTFKGSGTTTLSGNNTYGGGFEATIIWGGTVAVSSDANLGAASTMIGLLDGTLKTTADVGTARNVLMVGNGALDNGGHNLTLSGTIQGNGDLTFSGGGVTTLSGADTHNGATLVTAGTLKAGAANTFSSAGGLSVSAGAIVDLDSLNQTIGSLSGAGGVKLGSANLTTGGNNGSTTFSGVIEGSGALIKTGSGVLTLSGTNTYTGVTRVNGGGLSISRDANLGAAGSVILDNSGYLQITADLNSARNIELNGEGGIFSSGHNVTWSGVISGENGTLYIGGTGTGVTTLTGVNTYNLGTALMTGGTLAVASNDNLGGADAALLFMGGALRTLADFSSDRMILMGGAGTLDNGGHNALFSGEILASGNLLLKGAGTTTLSADSSDFEGTVNVAAGTLSLADTASLTGAETTVQSGATLRAGGASLGDLINDGVVAVNAGKTLSVAGDFENTGTFRTHLSSAASYGKISVSGTAYLDGGTLDVNVIGNPALTDGQILASLIHAAAIDGEFDRVTSNSALFDFGATYTATDVGLTLTAKGVDNGGNPGGGTTPPPKSRIETIVADHGNNPALPAARVLGRLFAGGSPDAPSELALRFAAMASDNEVNQAVTQSLPLLAGGSQVAANVAQSGINQVVQGRLDSTHGLSSGDGFLTDNHLWLKPFGSWADQNDRNGVSGYDASVGGLAIGTDGKLSDKTMLGVSFAYANASVDSNSKVAPNKVDVDVYQLVGYGSYNLDSATAIDFQLGAGVNKNKGKRELSLFDLSARADYSSLTALAGIGIGHTFTLNEQLRFTPSVRADYTWIKDKGYTEEGAGALNLKVDSRDTDSLILAVDGKLNYAFDNATSVSANLGAGYDTLNDQASVTSAYAGASGAAFTTKGLDLDPWLLRAGVGVSHVVDNGTEISLRYDAEKRNDFLNQTASVKVRWAF